MPYRCLLCLRCSCSLLSRGFFVGLAYDKAPLTNSQSAQRSKVWKPKEQFINKGNNNNNNNKKEMEKMCIDAIERWLGSSQFGLFKGEPRTRELLVFASNNTPSTCYVVSSQYLFSKITETARTKSKLALLALHLFKTHRVTIAETSMKTHTIRTPTTQTPLAKGSSTDQEKKRNTKKKIDEIPTGKK